MVERGPSPFGKGLSLLTHNPTFRLDLPLINTRRLFISGATARRVSLRTGCPPLIVSSSSISLREDEAGKMAFAKGSRRLAVALHRWLGIHATIYTIR